MMLDYMNFELMTIVSGLFSVKDQAVQVILNNMDEVIYSFGFGI